MTKKTDRLAALKAKDADERLERIDLDKSTLDSLIETLEGAITAAKAAEALCGDLVSDVAHHALKIQASAGPSVTLNNLLTLARQSRADIDRVLEMEAAKAKAEA